MTDGAKENARTTHDEQPLIIISPDESKSGVGRENLSLRLLERWREANE